MEAKWFAQAAWIYVSMAFCAAAAGAFASGRRRAGWWLFAAGFAAAAGGVIHRAAEVRDFPLRSLYEVFLVLGLLMFPLSVFSRRALGIKGQTADALLAVVMFFPAMFVKRFGAEPSMPIPQLQNPLFAPHVAAYMLAYVAMTKAMLSAVRLVVRGAASDAGTDASGSPIRRSTDELAMDSLIRMGFPLLTAGLALGCLWAKDVFGDWWKWDPKEMLSLATWLAFAAYFHIRFILRRRYIRVQAGVAIMGFLLIVATLLWLNLSSLFASYHSYAG